MIKKILVPLDGSKLAECALPYVEEIATKVAVEILKTLEKVDYKEGIVSTPRICLRICDPNSGLRPHINATT